MKEMISEYAVGWGKKAMYYLKFVLVIALIANNIKLIVQQYPREDLFSKTDAVFYPKWEKRFDKIKATLPFEYGIIGYITDWDVSGANYIADWDSPGSSYANADTSNEYVLTQFTMSPIVVSRNQNAEWILANMNADSLKAWLSMQPEEYEVIEFNYSMYLVNRK